MQYYKDRYEAKQLTTWLEIGEEGYCLRAVHQEAGNLYATNVIRSDYAYGLPEGSYLEFLDKLSPISETEFQSTWKSANAELAKDLPYIQSAYPAGKKVTATLRCFYPLGVMLDCDASFQAIAEYDRCVAAFGQKNMYPNQTFEFTVTGIDDQNLWIRLTP